MAKSSMKNILDYTVEEFCITLLIIRGVWYATLTRSWLLSDPQHCDQWLRLASVMDDKCFFVWFRIGCVKPGYYVGLERRVKTRYQLVPSPDHSEFRIPRTFLWVNVSRIEAIEDASQLTKLTKLQVSQGWLSSMTPTNIILTLLDRTLLKLSLTRCYSSR